MYTVNMWVTVFLVVLLPWPCPSLLVKSGGGLALFYEAGVNEVADESH